MMDFGAIPVKLGEPKRLACLGFGAGALIMGVAVSNEFVKYALFGTGLVTLAMTIAGLLNPVTVGKGLAPTGSKGLYASGSGIVDVGKGYVQPVYGDAYGASAMIPAGPATMAIAEVSQYQAEPMYLRYVTGVENEGKIVGQGG